ncbi:MAG: hypothetical protein WBQ17_09865 [Rhizomicrobium sp.]
MNFLIDPDVKAVAIFMQENIAAGRLVSVAEGVGELAPLLWGRYAPERIDVLSLAHPQPTPTRSEISRQAATGLEASNFDAGDGSEEGEGAA